ncbi:unnamed protein product, partial [marine sediment metagenome]
MGETLRPDEGGDETNCYWWDGSQHDPDVLENFLQVNEAIPDDESGYVFNNVVASWKRDLYKLPVHTGSGVIQKVRVYARVYSL